jgi:hypothetical protein
MNISELAAATSDATEVEWDVDREFKLKFEYAWRFSRFAIIEGSQILSSRLESSISILTDE